VYLWGDNEMVPRSAAAAPALPCAHVRRQSGPVRPGPAPIQSCGPADRRHAHQSRQPHRAYVPPCASCLCGRLTPSPRREVALGSVHTLLLAMNFMSKEEKVRTAHIPQWPSFSSPGRRRTPRRSTATRISWTRSRVRRPHPRTFAGRRAACLRAETLLYVCGSNAEHQFGLQCNSTHIMTPIPMVARRVAHAPVADAAARRRAGGEVRQR
jgi:hypothetical protein